MSDEALSIDFGSAVKGAVVGGVATVIESMVVGIPFLKGTPTSQAEVEAMTKALMTSNSFLFTDLGASLLCVALGGYVAAGGGNSAAIQGVIVGVVMLAVYAVMAMLSPISAPGWYTAAVFILTIPAAAGGGMLR